MVKSSVSPILVEIVIVYLLIVYKIELLSVSNVKKIFILHQESLMFPNSVLKLKILQIVLNMILIIMMFLQALLNAKNAKVDFTWINLDSSVIRDKI